MSCLTRNLQRQLMRYIQKHNAELATLQPDHLRELLVLKGVCPSDVTVDQLSVIIQQAEHA
jgi:hypothetical protein